jgi:hypothetical protein
MKKISPAAATEQGDLNDKYSEIEAKWTKPLKDAGWTSFPSVIIERQRALGLDAVDINILLHLAVRWWTADNAPFPAKGTIAAAMGVHPRTIQRRITKLVGAGFVTRVPRRLAKGGSTSNQYLLDGLIKHATPFAIERIAEKKARKEEPTKRAMRKRPQLKVVKT